MTLVETVLGTIITVFVTVWVIVVPIQILAVVVTPNRFNNCDSPIKRIEILFPGSIIGCYLGRPLK
jgi:hypothetical protein